MVSLSNHCRYNDRTMSFVDAIRTLNGLKRRGIIRDYVIIGAVAATAYMEPVLTEDLDIVVLADSDEDYVRDFRRVAEVADGMEGMHLILGGIPVQMFPSTTKPLYEATLPQARSTRIGGLRTKLAKPEHLILLYLEAFRDKDHQRIPNTFATGGLASSQSAIGEVRR